MIQRIVGVLAGDRVSKKWLAVWLEQADLIFAADAGADLVLACGFRPDYVVGDLDSVSQEGLKNSREVVEIHDQDFSDVEKLLNFVSTRSSAGLVLCGIEGSRIDHMLHAIHSVSRWPGDCLMAYESMLVKILKGPDDFTFSSVGNLSALPVTPCLGVSMRGVRWPIEDVFMEPGGFTSISNFSEEVAEISVEQGALMVSWSYDGVPNWSFFENSSGNRS